MQEAEINSEMEEVATHEAQAETQKQQVEQNSQDDYQARNWAAMRHKMYELEQKLKEKDDLIAKAILTKTQKEEEPEIAPDEYANYGGVQKVAKKTVQPLEEKLQKLEEELAMQKQRELLHSLRNKFSDFDQVVTPETLAILEQKEPELASSIADLRDPYKIGVQSYKYIKALNLQDDVPAKRRQKEAQKMLEKNEKSVPTPQAFDKRPMAQAFRMTEEEKNAIYNEMMGFASLAAGVPPIG